MRTTEKDDSIFKCDKNYQNPQNYTISELREWLKEQYKLSDIELTFREIFDTYSRFYGEKKEVSPKDILRTHDGQAGSEQVRTLEKLFEKYPRIKDAVEKTQVFANRDILKRQAGRLKLEIAEFKNLTKTEKDEIQEKITELTAQKEELLQNQKEHIAELDAQKARELAELKIQHKNLAAKRSRLLTRIENIETAHFETVKPSKASYDALLEFFPNADIKKIEEIDSFHEKLNNILAEEHEEALQDYHAELENVQSEIENLEKQIAEFENNEDFTTAFLMKFAKIQSEIDRLSSLLTDDEHKTQTAKEAAVEKRNLKADEQIILAEIEESINAKLEQFSETVLGKDIERIQFNFPTPARYKLGSPFDDGTGTDYISLILFDLSVLSLTKLPALIHDSYLVSNIRGERLENLLKIYAAENEKQIFLSIDETEKLNTETKALINKETVRVITLRQGGGELYGSCWAKKK